MTVIEGKLQKEDGFFVVGGFQIIQGAFLSLHLGGQWISGFMDHDGRNFLFKGYGLILYPKAGSEVRLILKERPA